METERKPNADHLVEANEAAHGRRAIWVAGAALAVLAWLLIARRAELGKLADTLAHGQWQWVGAAGLLQIVFYGVYTVLYQSAFAAAGVRSRARDLLEPVFQSLVVNIAAPGAGVGIIMNAVVRRGQSLAGAAAGAILVRVADFGTFAAILIAALIHLALTRNLKPYEVLAAAILLASTAAWALALALGLLHPRGLRASLNALQRAANRAGRWIGRPSVLARDWGDRTTADFTEAATRVAKNPSGIYRTVGVALGAHTVDILSLYAMFLAFHQPVSFETLVTGFAIGILFWVVSVTPQGIGVVEGMMALVFTQLGVPLERAVAIALGFRGLTFWLPLVIGFALMHRLRWERAAETPAEPVFEREGPAAGHPPRPARQALAATSVHLVALLAAAMAAVNLLSAVQPALRDRLHVMAPYLPLMLRQGARLTTTLAGFALLLLALGLWRRKRAAWWLTMLTLTISVLSHLVKGLDFEEAAFAAALMAVLWLLRRRFTARSDAPSVAQGLRVLALAALFTLGYGVAGFYLLDRHFHVDFGMRAAARQTVAMFAEFTDPGLVPITGFGRFFADSIYLVAAATFGYAAYMLLRPVLLRGTATTDERHRAETIVRAHGCSSLARLALLPDKAFFFSPGGSVFPYVTKGHIALTLGDVIGPSDDLAPALSAFHSFCEHNDWRPAFYQTMPETLDAYRAAGYSALQIGEEASVDLHGFSLEGGANKSMRTAVNRLTRLGYASAILEPPIPDDALEELEAVSNEWLEKMRGAEKGFSLGWFDDDYIRGAPVMVVRASDGAIAAFANIVPEYQRNEATVDLMRYREDTPSGTMDFLFVSLFQWAASRGFDTFNLGLSPLAGVGEEAEDPAVERALHFIYQHINQFYSFKGLHEYKAKFHPRWSPRYLIYPGLSSLPAVAMAILRADAGDNFVWDSLQTLRSARAPRIGAA